MKYSDLMEVAETAGKIFVLIAAFVFVFVLVRSISGDGISGNAMETVIGVVNIIVWPGIALLIIVAASELFKKRKQAIPGY